MSMVAGCLIIKGCLFHSQGAAIINEQLSMLWRLLAIGTATSRDLEPPKNRAIKLVNKDWLYFMSSRIYENEPIELNFQSF